MKKLISLFIVFATFLSAAFGKTVYVNANYGKLPAGYTECEYLEFTGTQYIDTGYKASDATILTVRFSTADTTNSYAIAGGRTTNLSKSYTLFALNTARNRYDLQTAQIVYGFGTNMRVANIPATVIMRNGTNYFDDKVDCSLTVGAFNCDYNLFLGAVNTAGTASLGLSGKLYFATIADGSGLVRDLVPCLNPSNVPGMYDLVGATFYPNAGTGDFLYSVKAFDGTSWSSPYTNLQDAVTAAAAGDLVLVLLSHWFFDEP